MWSRSGTLYGTKDRIFWSSCRAGLKILEFSVDVLYRWLKATVFILGTGNWVKGSAVWILSCLSINFMLMPSSLFQF